MTPLGRNVWQGAPGEPYSLQGGIHISWRMLLPRRPGGRSTVPARRHHATDIQPTTMWHWDVLRYYQLREMGIYRFNEVVADRVLQ